jgi:hypothetical protein
MWTKYPRNPDRRRDKVGDTFWSVPLTMGATVLVRCDLGLQQFVRLDPNCRQ